MNGPYGIQRLKNQCCSNCKRKKLEDRVIRIRPGGARRAVSGLGASPAGDRASHDARERVAYIGNGGEHKNTTVPTRSCGTSVRLMERAWRRCWFWAVLASLSSSILMVRPGAMAFTLRLYSPSSRASDRVSPITPAFEVT